LIAGILLAGMVSCNYFQGKSEEEAVARVFDSYLYRSDLDDAIPDGTSAQDSQAIARSFIDSWIRNKLMLTRAEEALTEEQEDVEKKIEEYRSSLLIYSYRQKLLQQKMDTVVTENEILNYYNENSNNFILKGDIVKAIFTKVALSAPNIGDVRAWTRTPSAENLDKLEKYSVNYAEKFDVFNNSWVYFSTLMEQVPMTIRQPSSYLRYNRNLETSDSLYHYFVHLSDYKIEGDISPIELVEDDIRSILLNKRKIKFYNELEQQVYSEGANRNQFEIY
jgi:hypothetical protein